MPAEAVVAGTAALLRSGSWVVDFPAEAPKREEGPKANPQGSETPALDVHLRPVCGPGPARASADPWLVARACDHQRVGRQRNQILWVSPTIPRLFTFVTNPPS